MTAAGQRPGDRRVRLGRAKPQEFQVKPLRRVRGAPAPATSLVLLFGVLITAGTILLMLPISSADGSATRFIDALFTATSAACVTGLVVVDTATHWSPFGQVVILLLIQAGGFGIMAGSTLLLVLFVGRRTTLRDRVLVTESLGSHRSVASRRGTKLLVNVAAGPSRAPGSAAGLEAIDGWHKMQDTYALLGTVAVAFCNRVGNEEGLTFWGGSRLVGPNGATIVQAPLWEEALVIGSIDTDDIRMQRYGVPLLADERLELVRRELDRIIAERADLPPTSDDDAP